MKRLAIAFLIMWIFSLSIFADDKLSLSTHKLDSERATSDSRVIQLTKTGGDRATAYLNIQAGTAMLYRRANSRWEDLDLLPIIRQNFPDYQIRHSSQLAMTKNGGVEIVLTIANEKDRGWGGETSDVVSITIDNEQNVLAVRDVAQSGGEQDWLPSLERRSLHSEPHNPALLFTRGANAGGHDNNVNSVETEVWLRLP